MGETAEMMFEGLLCGCCGVLMNDRDAPGYMRYCSPECAPADLPSFRDPNPRVKTEAQRERKRRKRRRQRARKTAALAAAKAERDADDGCRKLSEHSEEQSCEFCGGCGERFLAGREKGHLCVHCKGSGIRKLSEREEG